MSTNIVRKLTGLAILAGIVALGMARPAEAAFKLRLTHVESSTSVTITDQDFVGPPPDSNPVEGAITFIGGVGVFTVNVTTGLSKPLIGSATEAHMHLDTVSVSTPTGAAGAGTLLLELTDTDFNPTTAGVFSGLTGGVINSAAGSSIVFDAYKDPDNEQFVQGPIHFSIGPFGPGAFMGSGGTTHGPLAAPYSMTLVATLVHGAGGTSSFDFDVTNVVAPEPGTLAMAAVALPVLAIRFWRRRRQAQA